MRSSPSSFGSSSRRSNYTRKFDLPDDDFCGAGSGAMLPIFLDDLRSRNDDQADLVEVTLQLDDESIFVCSVTPTNSNPIIPPPGGGLIARSLSSSFRIRRKLSWLRSLSWREYPSDDADELPPVLVSARDARRIKARLLNRTSSSAERALKGLRFISKTTTTTEKSESESDEIWRKVESRFESLAKNGLLCKEDFGECIGRYSIYPYMWST